MLLLSSSSSDAILDDSNIFENHSFCLEFFQPVAKLDIDHVKTLAYAKGMEDHLFFTAVVICAYCVIVPSDYFILVTAEKAVSDNTCTV